MLVRLTLNRPDRLYGVPLKTHDAYPNFFEVNHPLVKHKLSLMRDTATDKKQFKELVFEITVMLAYELTSDLELKSAPITTPMETFEAPVLAGKTPIIVPILRAGLGMVDGFLSLMPESRVGHIGLYRDEETLEPQSYYFKVPKDIAECPVIVVDPMLATGGSASDAVAKLKDAGCTDIKFACMVAAPEGVAALTKAHPDIKVFAATLDRKLNSTGYIVPGLGDAGDRLFGTK